MKLNGSFVMSEWIDALKEYPKESGYYYTHYLNRDGKDYYKALGYNEKEGMFVLNRAKVYDFEGEKIRVIDNDCLKVYEWQGPRYEFYVPCMLREGLE